MTTATAPDNPRFYDPPDDWSRRAANRLGIYEQQLWKRLMAIGDYSIRDVAAAAGVSHQAIWKYLKLVNYPGPDTRAAIVELLHPIYTTHADDLETT